LDSMICAGNIQSGGVDSCQVSLTASNWLV
jgi:hypothetical protein